MPVTKAIANFRLEACNVMKRLAQYQIHSEHQGWETVAIWVGVACKWLIVSVVAFVMKLKTNLGFTDCGIRWHLCIRKSEGDLLSRFDGLVMSHQ